MKIFSRQVLSLLVFFFVFTEHRAFATGDTLGLSPRAASIAASINDMSEPELALLLDSMFDYNVNEPKLFILLHNRLDVLRDENRKNIFNNGFSVYPANRYYGVWNTKSLFPYSDSLYKSDVTTSLDLSPETCGDFTFPFNGPITSEYGWRDTAWHRGVDIDLNRGDSVRCAFAGMVRYAARGGGFGNVVIVRHYNGLETVYAHLSRIKVKPGDIVNSGQLLGLGGSTGHSTGTHLHFETRFRGVSINPAFFVDLKTHKLVAEHFSLVRTRQGYAVRPDGMQFHVVVRGDNLVKIAQHYGISIAELKEWNGWDGYVRLRAGMRVRVCAPDVTSASF